MRRQSLSGHCLQARIQAALVLCAAILLNQPFGDRFVDSRHGCLELGIGCGLVTGLNGLQDSLHSSSHARLQRNIVESTVFTLAGALFC